MNRLEVLVDGEWTPVAAEALEFTVADDEPVEAVLEPERTEWSLEFQEERVEGRESFYEAMLRLEREAFAAKCARRLWLRFPYRVVGAHG